MTVCNIQIVDSSRLFREGLKRLFVSGPFKVVSETSDLEDAFQTDIDNAEEIDLLLLQWPHGGNDLSDQIESLVAGRPEVRIVALADTVDAPSLTQALRAGVRGYLLKDMSSEALLQSLLLVQTGEVVFPTELASLLIAAPPGSSLSAAASGHLVHNLSQREMQILHGLIQGQSNKIIARCLNLAEGTVKVHLKSLLRKINARNRTQAAIWGLNNGLVPQLVPPPYPDNGNQMDAGAGRREA